MITTKEFKVTTGKKGEEDYQEDLITFDAPYEFSSLGEAVEWAGGEKNLVGLAVSQAVTNTKNIRRAEMAGTASLTPEQEAFVNKRGRELANMFGAAMDSKIVQRTLRTVRAAVRKGEIPIS